MRIFYSIKKRYQIFLFSLLLLFSASSFCVAYFGKMTQEQYEDNVYGKEKEFNLESHTNETFSDLVFTMNNAISGPIKEEYRSLTGGGAIGSLANLIGNIYSHPPVSSYEYFADLGRNLGIVKPAYAQGVGFNALHKLLPYWKASRNIAYIFFVLVFIFTGLAIMFRVKLDPKTVISIQNAIPKFATALILVTFSYAIAGLLIDLIYVLIYLGILAIGQTGLIDVASEQAKFIGLSFPEALGLFISGFFKSGVVIVGAAIGGAVGLTVAGIPGALVGTLVGGGLVTLIISIIALFAIFKLFISLIGCYISIILLVIVGPLQIMLGALPGSTTGFGSWFRNLLKNILVFPAVAIFLLLGWLFTGLEGPDWVPPVLGVGGGGLTSILGLAIILLVNKVPDIVKSAFDKKPFAYGTAIGEATGIITKPTRGIVGGAVQGYADRLPDESKITKSIVKSVGKMIGG